MDEKEHKARQEFDKIFGFLKDLDIPKEYIAIKCKVSKLPSDKRSRLLAYINIRSNNDPEYKKMVDKLDTLINNGLKVEYNESTNHS